MLMRTVAPRLKIRGRRFYRKRIAAMCIKKKAALKNILKEEAKWIRLNKSARQPMGGHLEEDHLLESQPIGLIKILRDVLDA